MPTYFSSAVSSRLYDFAVALGSAARIFTVAQLARHPDLSFRKQPEMSARQLLSLYPRSFESIPGPYGQPHRRRLSLYERRLRGIKLHAISGVSQRAEHWLGLGDIWMALTFHGGRPDGWRLEWDRQFDVYCVWRGQAYLIEYQRTPITEKQWQAKWDKRIKWYKAQEWIIKPTVVLVDTSGQLDKTIHLPKGTIRVQRIENLPRAITRQP